MNSRKRPAFGLLARYSFAGIVFVASLLHAQYPPGQYPPGQYPPGQYPPGQNPQGGGVSIPRIKLPKRAPKDSDAKKDGKATAETLQSVEGALRKLEEKKLALETATKGVLQFRLLAKTQFLDKEGKTILNSVLKPGDQLKVSFSPDDEETALSITLTRPGTEAEKETAEKAPDPPATLDTATRVSTPPKDDDKPVLRRGKQPQTRPDPEPEAGAAALPEYKEKTPVVDPLIAAARDAADSFTETLPDFLVQQHTMRYRSETRPYQWQAIDIVSADLTVIKGKEEYKKITINGKPANRPIEKTGSWSTGEFATTQVDILSPATSARFVKRGQMRVGGRDAVAYDFTVQQPNSHWRIIPENTPAYRPPYKGVIWIDRESKRVLKIEQQATSFPDDFPFNRVELILEYGLVRISGKLVLLPVRSENIICQSGTTYCARNELNFRNYRKFGAQSDITFEKD